MLPSTMQFIERDWLSSNQLLFVDQTAGEKRATLVDAGYIRHADTTVSLVHAALARCGLDNDALGLLVNTHLHSDHCGGNAALVRAFGCEIAIPIGEFERPARLENGRPVFMASDAASEPFHAQRALRSGDALLLGGAEWQVHAAPGHDPHSVILHCPEHRLLISADALWENGFGLIFPELVGEPGFQEQHDVLALIAALDVETVLPGHGAPFQDVSGALARARDRLAALRGDRRRNARNGLRVMIKYTLLDRGRLRLDELPQVFSGSAVLRGAAEQLGMDFATALAWGVEELARQGEIRIEDGWAIDRDADPAHHV
jgi:glyoxylase-like metal-dependent hydrolase (beta-lactamase superfamily II)